MDASMINDTKEIESIRANESLEPLTYRLANISDCESIVLLVNSSYRGESSHQGWTTEDELIGGPRIDRTRLMKMINSDGSVILLFFDRDTQVLVGCVSLQDITTPKHIQIGCCIPVQHSTDVKKALLGMLTVRPDLQARGYGKFIISVAENFVRHHWHVQVIEMSVLVDRPELIAYYIRRGYTDTGRRQPFLTNGLPHIVLKKNDLQFCILTKSL